MFRILVTFQKISEKLQWSCLSSSTLRNKRFLPCKHPSLSFLLVSRIVWSFLESFFWYSFLTSSKIKLCNASSQCDEPIVSVFLNILYPFVFWRKNRKRIFSLQIPVQSRLYAWRNLLFWSFNFVLIVCPDSCFKVRVKSHNYVINVVQTEYVQR